VVDEINANHTFGILPDEVSENNKRVAADVIHAGVALQTAVKSASPSPSDVMAKIGNLNATLQEAVAVRLPQDAAKNFTINLIGTKNLVNETLRQYGFAYGIANSAGAKNNSQTNPSSSNILNMSAYQTAKALISQAQDMFTHTKSLVPSNATSTTNTALTKFASDLSQLKSLVDAKAPYEKVATLVQKTVYPDINTASGTK
jgi:6-pyruvoyl-tetrahydropterin synthase